MITLHRTIIKILLSLSCLFFIISLIIAWLNPATGYELDIYESTPFVVWILISASMLCGAGVIFLYAINKNHEQSSIWLLGLSSIIAARFSCLVIPHVRGYEAFGGDNITYVGHVISAIDSGHFLSSDFYPVTHSILTSISLITGSAPLFLSTLMPAIISCISVLSIYILANATNIKKIQAITITVIAATVFLGGVYNTIVAPNGWSVLFMPFIYFLYLKRDRIEFAFLLLILLILYPFFHPLSSLLLILSLLIIEGTRFVYGVLNSNWQNNQSKSYVKTNLGFILIESAILFPWLLSFNAFKPNIRTMWAQITSGLGSGKFEYLVDRATKIDMQGTDLFVLIWKMFGDVAILLVLGCITIAYLLFNKKSISKNNVSGKLLPLGFVMICYGILYAAYLLGFPGMSSLGEGQYDRRILSYAELISPIFAGLCVYFLFNIPKQKKLVIPIVTVLILTSIALSGHNVYPSPFVMEPNNQITNRALIGADWFINSKKSDISTLSILTSLGRLSHGINGTAYRLENTVKHNNFQLQDHFGIGLLGDQYPEQAYIILSKKDYLVYETVWKAVGRFRTPDFEKLDRDITTAKLYENGDFVSYLIT